VIEQITRVSNIGESFWFGGTVWKSSDGEINVMVVKMLMLSLFFLLVSDVVYTDIDVAANTIPKCVGATNNATTSGVFAQTGNPQQLRTRSTTSI